jgi:hypothetical protein
VIEYEQGQRITHLTSSFSVVTNLPVLVSCLPLYG